jgi:hypothetical protein
LAVDPFRHWAHQRVIETTIGTSAILQTIESRGLSSWRILRTLTAVELNSFDAELDQVLEMPRRDLAYYARCGFGTSHQVTVDERTKIQLPLAFIQ